MRPRGGLDELPIEGGQRAGIDARYARDVLLVCDAMPETDLPQLAEEFRAATLKVRRADPPMPQPSFADAMPRSIRRTGTSSGSVTRAA